MLGCVRACCDCTTQVPPGVASPAGLPVLFPGGVQDKHGGRTLSLEIAPTHEDEGPSPERDPLPNTL